MEQLAAKAINRFKALHKRYGWKAVAGIFVYYLIRDLTIYVVIPYLAVTGLK